MAARVLAFFTLCILLCSLQGGVTAATSRKKSLHLTYFVHETRGGADSTLLAAAGTGQGNMSAIGWGTFLAVDNAMKSGNTSDSLLLGSITGTAVVTTIDGIVGGSQINTQHVFKQGSEYNGSSLTVIGTINSGTPPYECNIPGGTGLLRGYSGYGLLTPVTEATVPPLYVYQWDVYITYRK